MTDGAEYRDQNALDTFIRRVTSVTDPAFQRQQVHRHLRTVDVETACRHLDALLVRCVRGDVDAMILVLAVIEFINLASDEDLLAIENLYLLARSSDAIATAWFLFAPPPMRAVEGHLMQRMRGRALTLGERRAAAAGWEEKRLEVLLADPDPRVVQRLCANPRVREPHILTIVTRRPTEAATIAEVARHTRWLRNSSVRHAIASNPYAPTDLVMRLLPVLPETAQHRLRHAGDVHPSVRSACEYWLAVRTGVPSGPRPDELVANPH